MTATVLLLWLGLGVLELRCTHRNIGFINNGYGAVVGTLQKTSSAPSRYRVLVPWLVGWMPETWRGIAYLLVKWLLMGASLAAVQGVLSTTGTLALAVLMASTFEYDYWDCYAELLGVCLCLSGNPWLALLGAVVWGLSKETVFLAPVLAVVAGGWATGAAALAGVAVFLVVLKLQGKAALYSERITARPERVKMWQKRRDDFWGVRQLWYWWVMAGIVLVNPYNAEDLHELRNLTINVGLALSFAWTFTALGIALWGQLPPMLDRTAWVMLGWILAGWTLARARETRIFLPSAVWIAGVFT